MNINNFLLKSDKITFDYANKTIEHRENSKFQASIYSINKFIRYNSLCNENKKNTIKNASTYNSINSFNCLFPYLRVKFLKMKKY